MLRLPRDVTNSTRVKPRVLLVDDHPGLLERASAMLADDFDVAATAADGRGALQSARDIDPDVIVLDVNMRGLDGFRTCRGLQRQGSRAPVVFLSLVEDDEHMSEAFRCGGRGYVVKSQMVRDLASALEQVLAGRQFAPSLTTLFGCAEGSGHVMHLHDEEDSFLDSLATVFAQALHRGDATCVIATEAVRNGLSDRLKARGWLSDSGQHNRYLAIDAYDAMKGFMRHGSPDSRLLSGLAAELDQYRHAVTHASAARLTIFGNMVVPLVVDGNAVAAIALERHWNELTRELPFFTLCGYASVCFDPGKPELWSQVCAEHRAVSHGLSS